MQGYDLIRAERIRQVHSEGYTAKHDKGHAHDLMSAAAIYAYDAWGHYEYGYSGDMPDHWPWTEEHFKPGPTVKHTLIKAGALIAAAIDALQAEEKKEETHE